VFSDLTWLSRQAVRVGFAIEAEDALHPERWNSLRQESTLGGVIFRLFVAGANGWSDTRQPCRGVPSTGCLRPSTSTPCKTVRDGTSPHLGTSKAIYGIMLITQRVGHEEYSKHRTCEKHCGFTLAWNEVEKSTAHIDKVIIRLCHHFPMTYKPITFIFEEKTDRLAVSHLQILQRLCYLVPRHLHTTDDDRL